MRLEERQYASLKEELAAGYKLGSSPSAGFLRDRTPSKAPWEESVDWGKAIKAARAAG